MNVIKTKLKSIPILMWVILSVALVAHILFATQTQGYNFIPPDPSTKAADPAEYDFKLHTATYGSRDAYLYAKTAHQLMDTGIYGFDREHTGEVVKNAIVTPGYPLFLVGVFSVAKLFHMEDMTAVTIVNIILSLSTILLVYLIGYRLFEKKFIGILAALFYATYFPPLHFAKMALTEIPAIFFYCLSLYLLIKAYQETVFHKWTHMWFSVTFCIAIMIRPVLAPLILFAIVLVVIKKGIKGSIPVALTWLVGPILIILPWIIRNYVSLGEFVLFSTNSGNSWFAGANPFNLTDTTLLYEDMDRKGMSEQAYAFHLMKKGYLENFNLWFSWFTVGKTYELFKIPDAIYFYQNSYFGWFKLQNKILLIIAFISAILFRNKRFVCLVVIFIGYIGLSNLFLTIPRYGYYIIPIACLITSFGIYQVLSYVWSTGKQGWSWYRAYQASKKEV